MRHFFCTSCDYVWQDLDHKGCPECASRDVMDGGEVDDVTAVIEYDGHFEGNFTPSYFQDDTGE